MCRILDLGMFPPDDSDKYGLLGTSLDPCINQQTPI